MKVFRNLFESQLDRLLAEDNYLGSREPQKLLRELKSSSSLKKLQKIFQTFTDNPYKILKMLSVANILILYSKDYFSFIQDHFKWKGGSDEWLRTKFIEPYYKFIIRSCTSKQMYMACRNLKIKKQDALQTLFYCINMLKLLFKIVEKMPFLGRYYKQKNQASVGMAMEIIALQAQKLYRAFQFLLQDILRQKQYYIRTVQDQTMIRGVFMDQLSTINQEMTKLFLDKYFSPLSKGINVKVFRPEEHGLNCDKIFSSIASGRDSALRKSQRTQIQKALFPTNGKVNWGYYQQAITSPSQSLTSSLVDSCLSRNLTAKDLNACILTQPNQKKILYANNCKLYESGRSNRSTTAQHKRGNNI